MQQVAGRAADIGARRPIALVGEVSHPHKANRRQPWPGWCGTARQRGEAAPIVRWKIPAIEGYGKNFAVIDSYMPERFDPRVRPGYDSQRDHVAAGSAVEHKDRPAMLLV